MLVFAVVFGALIRVPSDGLPYPASPTSPCPVDVLCDGVDAAGGSLVTDASLITKVYFPRLLLPVSAVLSSALDFCVAFASCLQ